MSALTPHQRAVLEAVETYSGDDLRPRLDQVGRMAGLPPKKAARVVAALADRGLLAVQDHRVTLPVRSGEPETKEEPMAQQTEVFEYVTKPEGKVHLQRQRPTITSTLCGRDATGWTMGDETMSGVAATCGICVRVLGQIRGAEKERVTP